MTITERCADPELHAMLAEAHPRWWKQGQERGQSAAETTDAILRELCAGEPSETHPEVRALFRQLERKRAQIADEHAKSRT